MDDASGWIEEEKIPKYQEIIDREDSPFFKAGLIDVFIASAAIGYYYKKREPVKHQHQLFRTFTIGSNEKLWLMKSIAVSDCGLTVLKSMKDVMKINQEFANVGIDYLYDWHKGDDIFTSLVDMMSDILDESP